MLFSDSACGADRSGGRGCSRATGVRGEDISDRRGRKIELALGKGENEEVSESPPCHAGGVAVGGQRLAKGEAVLRERLLQVRRDFSALRAEVSPDKLAV